MTPPKINPCPTCLQFKDFAPSIFSDKLYLSSGQTLTVICPSGSTATVPLESGTVGFVLNFTLGTPPYPNLTLNCTGGQISVPVPDNTTQAQLDMLIQGMLTTCLNQIATQIGCTAGVFFNTQQYYRGCVAPNGSSVRAGALPAGVSVFQLIPGASQKTVMAAGTIQSTISVADANAKANAVLDEIFQTGNAYCIPGS